VADGAAHERDVQHPRERDVSDVAPAPGEQARVLDARHAGADQSRIQLRQDVRRAHVAPPPRATSLTAATIEW
jgi:hypothetical protein